MQKQLVLILALLFSSCTNKLFSKNTDIDEYNKKTAQLLSALFGCGKDEEVIDLANHLNEGKDEENYIFIGLIKNNNEVVRQGHHSSTKGDTITRGTHSHLGEVLDFLNKNKEGFKDYSGSHTPSSCKCKRSYMKLTRGDKGNKYIVGQGRCLEKN